MPTSTVKPVAPARPVAASTKTKSNFDPTALTLKNLQGQEQKALEKLERIKTWPKEHQNASTIATQKKLSQIREAMKKLAN